jgi:hypothetical protein
MSCSHENCPGTALWLPVLTLQASPKSPVVDATFSKLGLCEMHKDQAKLTDYLTQASWDRIVRFMAECGKPVPRRNLTTLRFVSLTEQPTEKDDPHASKEARKEISRSEIPEPSLSQSHP